MIRQRNLYILVPLCSLTGLSWTCWNMVYNTSGSIPGCLFRYITGWPCPSCGSTRAVMHIFQLHFGAAFYANPIGFLLAAAMLLLPLWIGYDVVTSKHTFYNCYRTAEVYMRRKWVFLPFIILVLANWIWNIYKFTA